MVFQKKETNEIKKSNNLMFCDFVLNHLREIPKYRWDYFREIGGEEYNNYSQYDLIHTSIMLGGMQMQDYLGCFPDGKIIGRLGVNPVYFSNERGIYLWQPDTPDDLFVREIWLTFPTIPKDWS